MNARARRRTVRLFDWWGEYDAKLEANLESPQKYLSRGGCPVYFHHSRFNLGTTVGGFSSFLFCLGLRCTSIARYAGSLFGARMLCECLRREGEQVKSSVTLYHAHH